MRTPATLPGAGARHSSDSVTIAKRAILEMRETHGFAPDGDGYCEARFLVDEWHRVSRGVPMPVHALRDELRRYLFGDDYDRRERFAVQRDADAALAVALLDGDVRLAPLPRRARR